MQVLPSVSVILILLVAVLVVSPLTVAHDAHDHSDHHHGHDHDHHHHHDHDHHHHDHGHHHHHGEKNTDPSSPLGLLEDLGLLNLEGERTEKQIWAWALGCTVIICCAPVVILLAIPLDASRGEDDPLLKTLLSFAAGGLLGDVFLHLLPHALLPHDHHAEGEHGHDHDHGHGHDHDHSHGIIVGLWVLAGILAFFVVEKWVRAASGGSGHGHSHGVPTKKQKKKGRKNQRAVNVTGWLNLVADFSHNFTDGLAIGASFLASQRLGLITTFAVLLHEVPHEVGDFAILVRCGFSRKGAMLAQLSTAIGALIGTSVGLLAKELADSTVWILPFTAGGFIYIALVTVIPDLLKDQSFGQSLKEVLGLCLGIAMMVGIAAFE